MRAARTLPWVGVVALAALAATLVDSALLQVQYRSFTGGFLNPDYVSGAQLPLFVLASLWVDAAVVALFALPALWLVRRVPRLGRAQRLLVAAALSLAPLMCATVMRHEVPGFVADVLQHTFARDAGNGFGARTLLGACVLIVLALVTLLVGAWLARYVPDRRIALLWRGSRTRRRAAITLAVLVIGAFVGPALLGERLQIQLRRKVAARWTMNLGDWLTDFDRDGAGLVHRPRDGAPFDARRRPFAVDWPQNGVDENGLGGDLASRGDFVFERHGPVHFVRRPDVLLIILESFRADNVQASVDGRAVAPVLRGLLADGAITGPAYSHSGYTVPSLVHLFSGSLTGTVQGTIFDDFNANGYLTACFSGEDESFKGMDRDTGVGRADVFFDARDHQDERIHASTSPGSLTVPGRVVVRDLEQFLEERGGEAQPFFVYLNLQDCHYPYHHYALEPLLNDRPVTRVDIHAGNKERVRRTYLNAAANVDAWVGRILESFQRARGRAPAFVILGDHGESLFEDGVLGHGVRLTRVQTQIPFLVRGLPTECVFPLGHADVRGLLRRALAGKGGRATATVDPDQWVMQYVGPLDRPQLLGGASANGGVIYDLRRNRYSTWGDPAPSLGPPLPALTTLWEQIILRRAEHRVE